MSKITSQRMLSEMAAALAARPPQPYELWRTLPAESFDEVRKLEVMCHIGMYRATTKEWKDAIAGDAASAIGIVLRMKILDWITYPTDARMTVLLYAVLNGSAGAALVLAHLLRKMPLDTTLKNRLATSWLVRNLRLAGSGIAAPTRRLGARRSIAAQLLGNPERES